MEKPSSTVPGVPGVSAGTATDSTVEPGNPPGEAPRLSGDVDAAKKSVVPYGGKSGGRPRNDGLVPGSEAALAEDRKKAAERKQRQRDRERAQRQATTLPPAIPADTVPAGPPEIRPLDGAPVFATDAWLPEDFNFVVSDCIQITESWRVKSKTDKAIKGKLPPLVAEEMGKSFAFPPESKTSLRASSPAGFAKAFNLMKIPLAFKPVISACPAIAYLIIRDQQLDAKLDKMIEEQAAKLKPAPAPAPTPAT